MIWCSSSIPMVSEGGFMVAPDVRFAGTPEDGVYPGLRPVASFQGEVVSRPSAVPPLKCGEQALHLVELLLRRVAFSHQFKGGPVCIKGLLLRGMPCRRFIQGSLSGVERLLLGLVA